MRIVVFSSCGARATYILRRVFAEHDVRALVHVASAVGKKDKPRSLSEKVAKLRAPVKTVTDRGATAYRSWRMEKNERELSQRLFDRDTPPLLDKVTKVPRDRLHAAETLTWLRSLDADLFLVVSAPILKPELFTIAKSGAVNVHFGIAARVERFF